MFMLIRIRPIVLFSVAMVKSGQLNRLVRRKSLCWVYFHNYLLLQALFAVNVANEKCLHQTNYGILVKPEVPAVQMPVLKDDDDRETTNAFNLPDCEITIPCTRRLGTTGSIMSKEWYPTQENATWIIFQVKYEVTDKC